MSRFWGRIVKMVPRFMGTKQQAEQNFMSHRWQTVDLDKRFGVAGVGTVVECQRCGILSDTTGAEWPCGEAPEPVDFNTIVDSYKK